MVDCKFMCHSFCVAGVMIHITLAAVVMAASVPGASANEWELQYQVTVNNIPVGSRSVSIWVPLPQNGEGQSISGLEIESPIPHRRVIDAEYGNVALLFEAGHNLPDSVPLSITFHAGRSELVGGAVHPEVAGSASKMKRFLSPDSLIPVDGEIAELARSVVLGQTTDRLRAKAIYDYILETMMYDKSGFGWGEGDAMFACSERRGNCSDIHSLLIGMARASGIPARFVMGFPLPPGKDEGVIAGYHCWADLYFEGVGWVPIDASEAIKHRDKASYYFGSIDPDRVAFSIGRDIKLGDGLKAPRVNYFIYPVVRVDGRDYADVSRQISFRKLTRESRLEVPSAN